MKSEDGRYTVAQESEAFPYFTINVKPPGVMCGNRGGVLAFFERSAFLHENLNMITELGVVVDSDCGFHVRDEHIGEILFAECCAYLYERGRSTGWDQHEAL